MRGVATSQHQPAVATQANGQKLIGGNDIQTATALPRAISQVERGVADEFSSVDGSFAGD